MLYLLIKCAYPDSREGLNMKVPLLLKLFCRSPFTLRLMLLEMLLRPKDQQQAS